MSPRPTVPNTMRIWHRYLGFFLAGIMTVYAISGTILIFRNTNFLKREKIVHNQLQPGLSVEDLGKAVRMRDLKIQSDDGTTEIFEGGSYNRLTGAVSYTTKTLAPFAQKLTRLHKASTGDPLFFLNVFFAAGLLFFVISSFWMFMPKTSIFRKGMIFVGAGIALTLALLFL